MKTVVGIIGVAFFFVFTLNCVIGALNRTEAELEAIDMPPKKELIIGGIIGFALTMFFWSWV